MTGRYRQLLLCAAPAPLNPDYYASSMSPSPTRLGRAAPPPFFRQRARSMLLLGGLLGMIGVTIGAGVLVTVPTYLTVPAAVETDAARCIALGAAPGQGGCVEVRIDPAAPVAAGMTAHVTLPGDPTGAPVVLQRVMPAADGGTGALAVGRWDRPTPAMTTGTASITTGHRSLALLFFGRGVGA